MTDKPQEILSDTHPPAELLVTCANLGEVINGLRAKLQETTDPQLATTREKFERIYERLLETAARIVSDYRVMCMRNHLDPGKIRLYMVGGRVKGKPLKQDSDIDLIFCVDNYKQSPEKIQIDRFANPMDACDFKLELMDAIFKSVASLCKDMGLPNEFHILSYGSPMTSQNPQDSLLLAEG